MSLVPHAAPKLYRDVLTCWLLLGSLGRARGEDGSAAWLRYAHVSRPALYAAVPAVIVASGQSLMERAAVDELARGLTSMLDRPFTARVAAPHDQERDQPVILLQTASTLAPEQFRITAKPAGLTIAGGTPRGELYGAFRLLEVIASEQPIPADLTGTPSAPIRWTDEWDNLDGTVERGYAGPSIFFAGGHVVADLTRAAAYARLLASVGINGANVNNVNADPDLLTSEHLQEFARLAAAMRPWGVRLALSVDLASPQTIGHLASFDPLDPAVIAWWQARIDMLYALIPDFAGFTVKADSEGRRGPSQYGRSPADAANLLARALAPHGGVVLYRGFVYNSHLDWRDPKADRARAGVDNFARYDGQFLPNVIIQIKEGPIDFQAREPVSPLFAALPHTAMAIELQTTQEYTGQQRHMVWLPSMWKWVLDTDLRAAAAGGGPTPVKAIVTGHTFALPDGRARTGGFVSVTNVGAEANWLHHPMALANLYGFGKLAWNPDQPLAEIIDTWTRLTWGNDPAVVQTITALQLGSWRVYEGYTGPNGLGTLTNILGFHFGPGVESAERNGWGQWLRADAHGIGMERTAHGTGFAQQYPPALAAEYESLSSCPPELLLFFHHLPYDYRMADGRTLVQTIYDTHYASARAAAEYVPQWIALESKVDPERYRQVLALFNFQAGHALVWRDAIVQWFARTSGMADQVARAQNSVRLEAEAMEARGFRTVEITPWETASGGKAVECEDADGCTLSATLDRPAGLYDLAVQYYDLWRGVSRYELTLNGSAIARWSAEDTLPAAQFDPSPDGQDSTRYTARHVRLAPGDRLVLHAIPDLRAELNNQASRAAAGALNQGAPERHDYRERAPVDYLEIAPASSITPQ